LLALLATGSKGDEAGRATFNALPTHDVGARWLRDDGAFASLSLHLLARTPQSKSASRRGGSLGDCDPAFGDLPDLPFVAGVDQ